MFILSNIRFVFYSFFSPIDEWDQFLDAVEHLNNETEKVWCPITESCQTWINIDNLKFYYGSG